MLISFLDALQSLLVEGTQAGQVNLMQYNSCVAQLSWCIFLFTPGEGTIAMSTETQPRDVL